MNMDLNAIGDPTNKLKGLGISSLDDDDGDDEEVLIDNEHEDYDSNDEEEEDPITLGFVEKPKNKRCLQRQYFPSKAGGGPAWLDPVNIPSGRSCMCDICGEPLQFLLQVYAPTEKESTFHRMLFVFMCPSMKCLLRDQHEQWKRHPNKPSRSVKVFRCQLPRDNTFYSSERPKYDESDKPVGNGAALCDWCGTWKGDKLCSSCRQVRYCSDKHQVRHWRSGHKIACPQVKVSTHIATSVESRKDASNTPWPEFEIIIEDESDNNNTDISESKALTSSLISKNRNDDMMNSILDSFQGDDDKKSWVYFQERIASAPEQILRYYRNTNARPIWPVSSGRPSKADIPKCSHCGGSMCCEFQILPQLLYYLGVDNEANSMDWASVVVYTCEASCDLGVAYKEEYAWVQLYLPSPT
ncbi:hypothetical protein K1719_026401 [Acacia pycnantha]|nr:hypothetical protein K1719_026401 [Acacia pycnantha]